MLDRRREIWERFVVARRRGARDGETGPEADGRWARIGLQPVYAVAARTLVALDNISRVSVRQGNLRVGVGREEYADDGENVLRFDMNTEDG
jgi:hypothetical protein